MNQAKTMQAVWRERAERLSKRPVSAEGRQNTFPVLVLGIGMELYGIDLADVAEVLQPIQPTPVPGAAALFAGVINVHGEIRPVIDLQRFLQIETAGNGPARVILLRRQGREIGLRIDSAEQIRWIGTEELQPAAGSAAEHVRGRTKDLLTLLRTEALFAVLEPDQIETGVTN